MTWDQVVRRMPIVPIVRGITPKDAVRHRRGPVRRRPAVRRGAAELARRPGRASPRCARPWTGGCWSGAGTVLTERAVADVAGVGGQFVVSPNTDIGVIAATKRAGMTSLPGFFTPSEAFAALAAGADALKLFPAEAAGPATLKAIMAVLPKGTPVMPVGGVSVKSMAEWRLAGAAGFGIGGSIYKPGNGAEVVHERARAFAEGWSAR